jgi:hypothetical protein
VDSPEVHNTSNDLRHNSLHCDIVDFFNATEGHWRVLVLIFHLGRFNETKPQPLLQVNF